MGREPRSSARVAEGNNYPLKPLRDYRNRLLHGRIPPVIEVEVKGSLPWELVYVPSAPQRHFIAVPRIGHETKYLDWRKVVGEPNVALQALRVDTDFAMAQNVLSNASRDVLAYLQQTWTSTLVPALT